MNYHNLFNENKAAHSAAFFLFKANGRLPVLKLMKLLYLAERKSFEMYGLPIIGDSPVSMDHGPVLSMTLNRVNGMNGQNSVWESWIADREGHDVALRDASMVRSEDDLIALSGSDIEVLSIIWNEFGSWEKYRLRDYTHEQCKEWTDPKGSSFPIKFDRLLNAVGHGEEAAKVIESNLQLQANINQAFSSAASSALEAEAEDCHEYQKPKAKAAG